MEQSINSVKKHRIIGPGGKWIATRLLAAVALCASILPIACTKKPLRVPGSPALELRGPVNDLAAIRAENYVAITWSMPRKGAHRLAVKGAITVRVWRRENAAGDLTEVGEPMHLAPGAAGSFSEELPQALSSGTARVLYYFVELLDRNGRSTGLSNYVGTLAGGPPPLVEGLSAEMTDAGVLLRWKPALPDGNDSAGTAIRLHRIEVVPTPADETAQKGLPAPAPEQNLWIADGARSGHALDKDVRYGHTYVYQAQRVSRVAVGDALLELPGQYSAPARIYVEK